MDSLLLRFFYFNLAQAQPDDAFFSRAQAIAEERVWQHRANFTRTEDWDLGAYTPKARFDYITILIGKRYYAK